MTTYWHQPAKCISNTKGVDQCAVFEENLQCVLPITRVPSRANNDRSFYCWTTGKRAQLGRQRDGQTLIRCRRLLRGALLVLDKRHQLIYIRTPAGPDRYFPDTGCGHWFPPRGAARDHLWRYQLVCTTGHKKMGEIDLTLQLRLTKTQLQ